MGNKATSGKNGITNFTSNPNLTEKEKTEYTLIETYYTSFISNGIFDEVKLNKEVFLGLQMNSIYFLNSYYKLTNTNTKIDNLRIYDFTMLFNILIKENQNDESIYFKKNTCLILYDMYIGKLNSHEEGINSNKLLDIFNFIVKIYISRHENKLNEPDLESLEAFLKSNLNINDGLVDIKSLNQFLEHTLYSFDPFVKNHFRIKFLNSKELINSTPLLTEASSSIKIEQFLFFLLANPHMSYKKYAFKLFDCKKSGYNIPNLIYSFIGFEGPVAIFVKHMQDDQEVLLGLFIYSNIKECYEKFCGDDYSFLFSFSPDMKFYKCTGDRSKICFISSKNQKFSKVSPGIGAGFYQGKCRFWIDANECFYKSFFNKYDDVFEEGSPFEIPEQKLNIVNIEVYGFGNEDAYNSLKSKQNRDKQVQDKMKKCDRAAFADSEFNKEMFFENTFGHQKFDKKDDVK